MANEEVKGKKPQAVEEAEAEPEKDVDHQILAELRQIRKTPER